MIRRILFLIALVMSAQAQTSPTVRFNSLADLQAYTIPSISSALSAIVGGTSTNGDQLGGVFVWNANATDGTNGANLNRVIAHPYGSASGRWIISDGLRHSNNWSDLGSTNSTLTGKAFADSLALTNGFSLGLPSAGDLMDVALSDSTANGMFLSRFLTTDAAAAGTRPYGVSVDGVYIHNGTGTATTVAGTYGYAENDSGTVTRLEGAVGNVNVNGGTVINASAVPAVVQTAGGTITYASVLRSEGVQVTAGTVDRAYGLRIDSNSQVGGTVNTNFGIFVDYQGAVGGLPHDNYEMFLNGTSPFVVEASGLVGVGVVYPNYIFEAYDPKTTNQIINLSRGVQGSDTNMPQSFVGASYLNIGGSEYQANGIQTISFGYHPAPANNPPVQIGILTTSIGGPLTTGDLIVGTRSVTTDVPPIEAFRVTHDKRVGIGTTPGVPDGGLTVETQGDPNVTLKTTAGTTTAYLSLNSVMSGATAGALQIRSDVGGIAFGASGVTKMSMDANGVLTANGFGSLSVANGSPTATGWTNNTSINQILYVTAATGSELLDNQGNTEFTGVTIAAFTPIRIQPSGKFTGTGITYATGATAHGW